MTIQKIKNEKIPLIVRTIKGEKENRIPVWMMRQAGRHLPEYKELRSKNGSFLDFCYAPAAAAEATLQPVRRYDIDAAIIFSDILVIPDALGQGVRFKEGVGPLLDAIKESSELSKLNMNKQDVRLAPVYEALGRVREKLNPEQGLLGFAGAPWTLATYMIQGKGGDRTEARIFAYQNPEFMTALFDLLVEAISQHLIMQLKSGADAVQIFESWAEDLSDLAFAKWVIAPTKRIVDKVRAQIPDAAIIGFPRGASQRVYDYKFGTGVDAVGVDIGGDLENIRARFGETTCIQGNLDPMCLVAGGDALDEATRHILETAKKGPHIFNLGHGIVPQTPIANVERMISVIRGS